MRSRFLLGQSPWAREGFVRMEEEKNRRTTPGYGGGVLYRTPRHSKMRRRALETDREARSAHHVPVYGLG